MRSERWALAVVAVAGVGLPVVGGLLSLLMSDFLYLAVGLTCAVPALIGGGVALVASRQSRTGKVQPPTTAEPKRARAARTADAGGAPVRPRAQPRRSSRVSGRSAAPRT